MFSNHISIGCMSQRIRHTEIETQLRVYDGSQYGSQSVTAYSISTAVPAVYNAKTVCDTVSAVYR